MLLNCTQCQKSFERCTRDANRNLKRGSKPFCSQSCRNAGNNTRINLKCKQCGKSFQRHKSEAAKSSHHFCSLSCSTTYRNNHKTTGERRSKLERYLEKILREQYPHLDIVFNDRSVIRSELDIYFPSLKLAFELNGIFHYEPIFGSDKLSQTQTNDQRKFQACIEHGISLCVIDTSQQKYFKETTSQKYLYIICQIVNGKMAGT